MFWAEEKATQIQERFAKSLKDGKPILIRDEKTLSGRVHVGSMRGVAIHGAIAEALTKAGVANNYLYELNDFDVFDSIPGYLPQETFEPYLGQLLMHVPSPEEGFDNFAQFYGDELRRVIESSGFNPTFYWGSEAYLDGRMDGVIAEALNNAAEIRRIYKEVSGGERKDTWLPINVVCPNCKKVATTDATDWDGATVLVNCYPTKAPYTKGCGFEGRVSPFKGAAKLPWKPEWAAKWKVHSVKVEGGGKDHSTKGGSRDVANHIAKEVFTYEPPFDIPYEFFLVGGKKMSSSKGRGSSAFEIASLVPPKIFRLALLGKEIGQAFNFDPEGDTIPVLYDLYDKLFEGYKTVQDDDYAKLFELIHPDKKIPAADTFMPRFSQVAFIVQMPHMDLEREVEGLKGSALTDDDKAELAERARYATKWINECAPEKFVFKLQDTLPAAAAGLSEAQKAALQELATYIDKRGAMPSGLDIQQRLHEIKETRSMAPSELFGALYLAFLGKSYGPKIGWFLSVLQKDFVVVRLEEAAK